MIKLSPWFRQEIPEAKTFEMMKLFSQFRIHTVCALAKCPNTTYCFKNRHATFIILGDNCTRNCKFCAVKKSEKNDLIVDKDEPQRISSVVKELGLRYVVITSVTRDDLCDGGAGQFAETIKLVSKIDKNIKIEVLIPDFQNKLSSLKCIVDAGPNVVAHNIETIKRLYKDLRPLAEYETSLKVLARLKELGEGIATKSSLMLGLGESEEEVISTMEDLRQSLCDILTLGQYLAPSANHYPVKEFISIEQFQKYKEIGLRIGFKVVSSGPLVRSSFHAEEVHNEFAYV